MTNEEDITNKFKFKNMNRPTQVVFIGLLVGILLVGIFMVIIGILPYFESPVLESKGDFTKYPLSFNYKEYSSKAEIEIYNNNEWIIKTIWIGNENEYKGYKNGQLIPDKQHLFTGPFYKVDTLNYKYMIKPSQSWKERIIVEVDSKPQLYTMTMKDGISILLYEGDNGDIV